MPYFDHALLFEPKVGHASRTCYQMPYLRMPYFMPYFGTQSRTCEVGHAHVLLACPVFHTFSHWKVGHVTHALPSMPYCHALLSGAK